MAQVILPRNAADTIGGPIITAQMCCQWPRMGPVLQQKDAADALGWAHYCAENTADGHNLAQ